MQPTKILIVLTSHGQFNSGAPTGYWLSEVTHFYAVITAAGFSADFISPAGGAAPMDPASRDSKALATIQARVQTTLTPKQINPSQYAAIYYPGGHGPLWDLTTNLEIATIARKIYEAGGIVSAVCHGPAGLLPITLSNGNHLLTGKVVTGFSKFEERLAGKITEVPYILEEKLRGLAKRYTKALLPYLSHVEVDGRLITGQNPTSAKAVGIAVVQSLHQA